MFYPIFSRLREAFINEELLPANDETFISAQNAVLTRSNAVRNLLTYAQLSSLFPRSDVESDGKSKWLSAEVTRDQAPNLRKYLMKTFKIKEVTPPMFANKLSADFLSTQTDEWFVKFYKFLYGQPGLWNSEISILRTKPILRLEDGTHVDPPREGLIANAYLLPDTEVDSSLPIMRSKISQNKDVFKFLKELGVPKWDIVAEVIRHILPKYRNNQPAIPRTEYDRDFVKIVNAYKTDSQEKKKQLRAFLLTTPFILAESSGAGYQTYFKPNQLCFGSNDKLWKSNSIENYSRVSVSEEVCEFLQTLNITKWDAVEEVIKTILPKYKRNPPRVPIKEHMSDFKEITLAYEASEQDLKTQLKTELQTTHFILAESPDADFPIYLKPDLLYFATDTLRSYFESGNLVYWIEIWNDWNDDLADLWNYFVDDSSNEPPIAGAFVNLDKYPDTARALFEDLGVADFVRIDRKEDFEGNVCVESRKGNHKRGLNGFDPNIRVDGLEYALDRSTVEKSAFIWNRIVIPNADCIKGTIEKSTRQDYWRSSFEEIVSDFGSLLIDSVWLPDSNGNRHKPSEIVLEDLPEEFIRDERLVNLLGMKKDIVAELAEEAGLSVEIIEEIRRNPEEYKQFKTWQAEKRAHEEKEKKSVKQPAEDATRDDSASTLPTSFSNIDEGNNGSTTKNGEVPGINGGNTDSVENKPALHTSSQPSLKSPSSQDNSRKHIPPGSLGQILETTGVAVSERTEIVQDLQDDESLKQGLEKLLKQRHTIMKNRRLGKQVEDIVGQILEERFPGQKFDMKSVHEGADFEISEIEVTQGDLKWWIEVKSTRTESNSQGVIISAPQAKKAVKEKDKFLICVVPIQENIEPNLDAVRENMRFITNIGGRIVTLCQDIDRFEAVRANITGDISSDVKVVVDGGKASILIKKSIWEEDGFRLEELAEHLIPTSNYKVK